MTISYCVTVCNEHEELNRLLTQLVNHLKDDDEIIVQADSENFTKRVETVMLGFAKNDSRIKNVFYPLNKNFADYKNNLFSLAKNDYICFIDADEYLSETLIENIHVILEMNPVDVINVPRANTVEGITDEHIIKWRWRVENGLVNWPDYQMRLVKNADHLRWEGKVHERIVGFRTVAQLPLDNTDWCFFHPKTIERQEKQNELYNKI